MQQTKSIQAIDYLPVPQTEDFTASRGNKQPHQLPFPLRLGLLIVGSVSLGFGASLTFLADIGVRPLDLFADALSEQAGMPIAVIFWGVAFLMILIARLLGSKPGPGTFVAPMIIGAMIQIFDELSKQLPTPTTGVSIGIVLLALPFIGLGAGATITSGLGPGFPDLLTEAMSRKTRQQAALVRTFIEVSILLGGILLGGSFGIGTIMVALLIGSAVRYGTEATDRVCYSDHLRQFTNRPFTYVDSPPKPNVT